MSKYLLLLLPLTLFSQEKRFDNYLIVEGQKLIRQSSLTHMGIAYGNLEGETKVLHLGKSNPSVLYDLASLTKIFTTLSFLLADERGSVNISDSVFDTSAITFENLLRHIAGLPIGVVFNQNETASDLWDKVFAMRPKRKLVGRFRYSDVNYLLLGKQLERIYHNNLDKIFLNNILVPLEMNQTFFSISIPKEYKCALTDKKLAPCLVHDPTSRKLRGVTGHAGIFSTLRDLTKLSLELLSALEGRGKIFSQQLMQKMMKKDKHGRYLGFDSSSAFARRSTGNFSWSESSFGHTGFTGTSFFIDPEKNEYLIILSNAVYKSHAKDSSKRKYFQFLENISLNFTRYQK